MFRLKVKVDSSLHGSTAFWKTVKIISLSLTHGPIDRISSLFKSLSMTSKTPMYSANDNSYAKVSKAVLFVC